MLNPWTVSDSNLVAPNFVLMLSSATKALEVIKTKVGDYEAVVWAMRIGNDSRKDSRSVRQGIFER